MPPEPTHHDPSRSSRPGEPLRLLLCGGGADTRQRVAECLAAHSVAPPDRHIDSPSRQWWEQPNNSRPQLRFDTPRRGYQLCWPLAQTPSALAPVAADSEVVLLWVDGNTPLSEGLPGLLNLLRLLGLRHLLWLIDTPATPLDEPHFAHLRRVLGELSRQQGFCSVTSLPCLAPSTAARAWYGGPSLLETLDKLAVTEPQRVVLPLARIEIADCGARAYRAVLSEGVLALGDELRVARSGETARVVHIHGPAGPGEQVNAGQSVLLHLHPDISARADDILSLAHLPLETSDQFEATLVWLDDEPGLVGRTYELRLANQQTSASLTGLKHRYDLHDLSLQASTTLQRDDVSRCTLATQQPLAFDAYAHSTTLGGFWLQDRDNQRTLAFGMLTHSLRRSQNVHAQALTIGRAQRERQNGHRGQVIWFTGLSGSGKSTLANALEVALHTQGYRTYVLDGDNVRQGLNKDLGFTDADRVENIRRIAEVAKLMMEAGLVVMTAFISPFRRERQMARDLIGAANFREVYVSTPLEVCEQRDVKGLYKKARAGQLPNLSGLGSPYEPPLAAEHVINAGRCDLNAAVLDLLARIVEAQ
ncbi:MAG: adenylyl-sulfate kinase [Pseudomonas sp.]|uniref:adenylyl-sulfate kinase n=1 Tax=Pseudomonas sp. TaxID=306 RepID=UPI003395BF93